MRAPTHEGVAAIAHRLLARVKLAVAALALAVWRVCGGAAAATRYVIAVAGVVQVSLLVLVDSLGCYQALDGDHRDAMIRDRATGTKLPDSKAGFDGCYDVYDGRTGTSKT